MSAVLRVQGMSCQHCVDAITAAVRMVPGVTEVHVDLANSVVAAEGTPDMRAVVAAIEDSGYEVEHSTAEAH